MKIRIVLPAKKEGPSVRERIKTFVSNHIEVVRAEPEAQPSEAQVATARPLQIAED